MSRNQPPPPQGGGGGQPQQGGQGYQNRGQGRQGGNQHNLEMYVSGHRNSVRVRVSYFVGNTGVNCDFILMFGDESDPMKNVFSHNRVPLKVRVVGGNGVVDGIDLTTFPQYSKVAIKASNGREIVKDLPKVDPQGPPLVPTGASFAKTIEVKVLASRPAGHTTNHTVHVVVKDQRGDSFESQFTIDDGVRTPFMTSTTPEGNHTEVVPVQSGHPVTYVVSLPNGVSQSVELAAPAQHSTPRLRGFFGG